MRILHVIPYMHPSAGGPPVVVENFIREMSKLGHLSETITSTLFCDGDEEALGRRLKELAPTTLLPAFGAFTPFVRAIRQRIGEGVRRADIIHLHTIWNPINWIVRQECGRCRRPYIIMPHGMLDPYSLSVSRGRKTLYFKLIERANIEEAQRLIFTTPEEERLATPSIMGGKTGVVIPLGGDPPGMAEGITRVFFERFPMARGRRQLLFLGRLHYKKGLDRILMALPAVIRSFPDVLLTVVGDGTTKYKDKLVREIQARGLENNVMMAGRLDGDAKWGAYAAAELFLLPSRQENFAITVAEAMHMCLPVIVSDRVNTWPYVKEANAGIVLEDGRIESGLAESILSLLTDGEASRKMGKRGKAYAINHLTWAGAANKLLKCYGEVVSDWRSTGHDGHADQSISGSLSV
jgi:glycosyltransferase involved in cell wall biosynthesis